MKEKVKNWCYPFNCTVIKYIIYVYKLKNTVNNCHRFTKVFVSTHIKYVFSKSFWMVNKHQQSFELIINAAFLNNIFFHSFLTFLEKKKIYICLNFRILGGNLTLQVLLSNLCVITMSDWVILMRHNSFTGLPFKPRNNKCPHTVSCFFIYLGGA